MPATLLHLDSSPRPDSFSRHLGAVFATAWRAQHPDAPYVHCDLARTPVPPIDAGWTSLCDAVLAAGVTDPVGIPGLITTPTQRAAWEVVEPLLGELLAADVVLLGVPMHNFSVPAALKAWIDQVTFPRMSLAGRSVVVAGARGGAYGPGTPREPFDHHETYLRDFFRGHFALDDVTFVHAELTNTRVDPVLEHLAAAHEESAALAVLAIRALAAELAGRRTAA